MKLTRRISLLLTLLMALLFLTLAGCAGVQSRVIGEVGKQAQAFVLTPEQTQQVRQMLKGQVQCATGQTAVVTAAKQVGDKITGVVRCE